jgi:23S rRNA (uracil1939-C5)-methyltransferase
MPPKPGDILEVTVDDLAYGGRGIARVDGFIVFVRGALPGDRVRALVTRRRRGFAEAKAIETIAASTQRVAARCAHHGDCGGCAWQTLAYETQLATKQRQVAEALTHIGGLDEFAVEPIIGMDDPWRYRNKMEFSFGRDGDRLVLGLHRRGSWREVVDLVDCHLAPPEINAARTAVAEVCRDLGLTPCSQETGTGLLRHLVVRRGMATGELFLNLFVTGRFAEEERLATAVAARQSYTSFAITVNATRSDAAAGEGPFMLAGPPYFHEVLAGVHLRVPALAFLQTNTEMCGRLYETALRGARPQAARRAYDLYCGIGGMALLLARSAGLVHGLEYQDEAIDAAIVNAALNGVTNVEFAAGDVRKLLVTPPTGRDEDLAARLGKIEPWRPPQAPYDPPAVVVTDPPRAGMSKKAVERMALLGAERIVYVSCNPPTLAANAAQLIELGYALGVVTPVDMFPHTHHVETVALFERGQPGASATSSPPPAASPST